MDNIVKELSTNIHSKQVILFVGAGVSASLGLPTFNELIDEIAVDLGYDKDIFNGYADSKTLAEYYQIQRGEIGELRSRLDKSWNDTSKIDIGKSKIHKLIVELDFPIIYTTNWDNWIELAYKYFGKNFHKIAGVKDLAKEVSGETKIIKFHGDFTDDESIVFTESKYLERMSLDSPLDIRFKSDSIGKTVLFIGYSLRDANIRNILYWVSQMWAKVQPEQARPKSFVFFNKPNPIEESVLEKWGIHSIVSQLDNSTDGLVDFLTKLKSNLSN